MTDGIKNSPIHAKQRGFPESMRRLGRRAAPLLSVAILLVSGSALAGGGGGGGGVSAANVPVSTSVLVGAQIVLAAIYTVYNSVCHRK